LSARDWSKEPYRKQLLRPSPSFRMLSVSAQGLFYVLMREADDDGFLPFAASFDEGCVRLRRLIGAHNEERRGLPKHLQDLLDDGCVRHEGDRLHLRSLRAINERRDRTSSTRQSDGGEPQGRQRQDRTATSERRQQSTGETPAERKPNTTATPAEHRSDTGETLVEHQSSVGETLAERRPDSDKGSSAGNYSDDQQQPSRARARSQVGREGGREGDQGGRKRLLHPAPDDHPVTELIAANRGLVHGTSPGVLAAGVIQLAGTRPTNEQVEATELALETVKLKLSTSGLSDPVEYFGRVVANLLHSGGLEAAREKQAPRSSPASAGPTFGATASVPSSRDPVEMARRQKAARGIGDA